jgi:hypothetical protein
MGRAATVAVVDAGRELAIAAASLRGLNIKRLAGRWWDDHWITPVLGYAVEAVNPPSALQIRGWNPKIPEFANNRVLVRVQNLPYQSSTLAPGESFSFNIPMDQARTIFELTIATLNQIEGSAEDKRQRGCHLYDVRLI